MVSGRLALYSNARSPAQYTDSEWYITITLNKDLIVTAQQYFMYNKPILHKNGRLKVDISIVGFPNFRIEKCFHTLLMVVMHQFMYIRIGVFRRSRGESEWCIDSPHPFCFEHWWSVWSPVDRAHRSMHTACCGHSMIPSGRRRRHW